MITEKKSLSKGGTERPWRPLWANDLWGSANFRSLPIYGKGIYDIIWSLCRDGKYAGMLCEPNGDIWSMVYIISAMVPQQGDRKDRIKDIILELVKRGMLYLQDMDTKEIIDHNDPINKEWVDGKCERKGLVLIVRKYAEKSAQERNESKLSDVDKPTSPEITDLIHIHCINTADAREEWVKPALEDFIIANEVDIDELKKVLSDPQHKGKKIREILKENKDTLIASTIDKKEKTQKEKMKTCILCGMYGMEKGMIYEKNNEEIPQFKGFCECHPNHGK